VHAPAPSKVQPWYGHSMHPPVTRPSLSGLHARTRRRHGRSTGEQARGL
jgi:hypothetical protein